ncbi:MAG: NAD(P)-binding domain-containing protein, partial [Erysipelotrichaceae bacterium]|nr:NAD(P)-binding domain-containing protein [Erysipelotrichaceae bacterium]
MMKEEIGVSTMKKIGFIGTGYMGGALATAASKSGLDIEILLANRHKEKAEALCKQ